MSAFSKKEKIVGIILAATGLGALAAGLYLLLGAHPRDLSLELSPPPIEEPAPNSAAR